MKILFFHLRNESKIINSFKSKSSIVLSVEKEKIEYSNHTEIQTPLSINTRSEPNHTIKHNKESTAIHKTKSSILQVQQS